MTGVCRTPLHALHLSLGARMVEFSGYELPLHYRQGILAEHSQVRARAGLFDVSHMSQLRLAGPQAAAALETLAPSDFRGLAPGRQRYSFFTSESGGILDDLMVANMGDAFLLVVNAARRAHDLALLQSRIGGRCSIEPLTGRALLALQGPHAAAAIALLGPGAERLPFMSCGRFKVAGVDCFVSRSGYTGEDGFEISVPAADAESVARQLLAQESVAPIGLGARDSLRLEAGLCLYGHDLDATTSPVEAGLAWAIPKARRSGGFPGAATILRQLVEGAPRRRVGLLPAGRAPLREGEILRAGGREVGKVTSGGYGASAGGPIALAYVESSCATPGTELEAMPRGKPLACRVVPLPFVPHRYFRGIQP